MPQFPFDFPIALILVLIPSLWQYIANPLVDEIIEERKVEKGHLKNINIITNVVRGLVALNFIVNIVI